jgi:hypothetical protein
MKASTSGRFPSLAATNNFSSVLIQKASVLIKIKIKQAVPSNDNKKQ